tara:strand:+ start:223 stop:933 length:711 start_codon:yes stop_codon:yes gene_type:complete
MKAIILAAGKGSRLGGITSDIPKPMIVIDNKPILQHNIELCRDAGIKDILINLHHLPHMIKNYFGDGRKFGINIKYNYEKELWGTAGALLGFMPDIEVGPFFVLYGDNYTKFNILELKAFNKIKGGDASILYHWRNDISQSGISFFSEKDQIIQFIEKPKTNKINGDWVNAGIYYFNNAKIFRFINKYDDFATHLFPKLILNNFKLFGCKKKLDLSAIDTPELLKRYVKKSRYRGD